VCLYIRKCHCPNIDESEASLEEKFAAVKVDMSDDSAQYDSTEDIQADEHLDESKDDQLDSGSGMKEICIVFGLVLSV
jgi:hypothetical protein